MPKQSHVWWLWKKNKSHKDVFPSFFHGLRLGYFKSEKKTLEKNEKLKKNEYERSESKGKEI
jgi:hypothetical protein